MYVDIKEGDMVGGDDPNKLDRVVIVQDLKEKKREGYYQGFTTERYL